MQNCNFKKMMITTLFQMFSLLQTVSFDVLSWKICFLGLAFLTFFKTRKVFLTKLTVFALAFLDQILIFDVFMTGFAVKPSSKNICEKYLWGFSDCVFIPFGLLCWLSYEKSNWICRNFCHVGVDANFRITFSFLIFHFNCQK